METGRHFRPDRHSRAAYEANPRPKPGLVVPFNAEQCPDPKEKARIEGRTESVLRAYGVVTESARLIRKARSKVQREQDLELFPEEFESGDKTHAFGSVDNTLGTKYPDLTVDTEDVEIRGNREPEAVSIERDMFRM